MSHHHPDHDPECCSCCRDRPVPVRLVPGDPYAGPDGETRLRFDVWVLKVLIVLYVVGAILY